MCGGAVSSSKWLLKSNFPLVLLIHLQDLVGKASIIPPDDCKNQDETERHPILDCSDDISADCIINRLPAADRGTLIVIVCLKQLDRKRGNAYLSD